MSLLEVCEVIKAKKDILKHEDKQTAIRYYNMASLLSYSFHAPSDFPDFSEFYREPDGTGEDNSAANWMIIREYMRDAADYQANKRGEAR